MSADEKTTEITVDLPDRLVESIDATVEQSGAYDDRDALVQAAITGETAGFDATLAVGGERSTTRRAVLDALREEEHTHDELLAAVSEDGHSVADVEDALSILTREGEIYCIEDVYRPVDLVPDGGVVVENNPARSLALAVGVAIALLAPLILVGLLFGGAVEFAAEAADHAAEAFRRLP